MIRVQLLLSAAALMALNSGTAWARADVALSAPPAAQALNGVWWNEHPDPVLHPVDGKPIPFTKAGQAEYEQNKAALSAKAGQPVDRNDFSRCLPYGTTRIMTQPFPVEVLTEANDVVLMWEHNHAFETVYLNDKLDPNADWAYMGNSVGQWTRDGLSVTTANYHDGTFLDDSGLPHSDQLNVVRTLRTVDQGKTLEITATITDPVNFTRPWTVRFDFAKRPDVRIEEYTCGQGPTLETRFTRAQALGQP